MFNDSKHGFDAGQTEYEVFMLEPHEWVPNNRKLPVVIYRRALVPESGDLAAAFEIRFERNAWPPQWRDGIFDYHHFHASAHEVLGVTDGLGAGHRRRTGRQSSHDFGGRRAAAASWHRPLSAIVRAAFSGGGGLSGGPAMGHPPRSADPPRTAGDGSSAIPRAGPDRRQAWPGRRVLVACCLT